MVKGDEQTSVVVHRDPRQTARMQGFVENIISAREFQRVGVIDRDYGIFPDLAVLEPRIYAVVGLGVADAAYVREAVFVLELLRDGERVGFHARLAVEFGLCQPPFRAEIVVFAVCRYALRALRRADKQNIILRHLRMPLARGQSVDAERQSGEKGHERRERECGEAAHDGCGFSENFYILHMKTSCLLPF